jgi:hypothetical protein
MEHKVSPTNYDKSLMRAYFVIKCFFICPALLATAEAD